MTDGRIILEWFLKCRVEGRGLHLYGLIQGTVVGFCEQSKEPTFKITGNILSPRETDIFSRTILLYGVISLLSSVQNENGRSKVSPRTLNTDSRERTNESESRHI
jgi:hypothetical protein